MLVDAKSPIKSVPELIQYAKKNCVLYGSPGVGNELHLKAELFNQQAGVKMEHVPYKGASEVMTGLLSGAVGGHVRDLRRGQGSAQARQRQGACFHRLETVSSLSGRAVDEAEICLNMWRAPGVCSSRPARRPTAS